MVNALLALLAFQLAGEVLVRALSLPVPGPVVGMLLLFAALRLRGAVPRPLATASQGLLNNLALLFVPAGVGVMVHLDLLRSEWLPLLLAIILSTAVTLAVTALAMTWLIKIRG